MDETYQIIDQMLAEQYPDIAKWSYVHHYKSEHKAHFEFFVFFMVTEYFVIESKIPLIKLFRHVFSSSLKDAKEIVEDMEIKSYLYYDVADEELKISSKGRQYIKDYEYLMPKDYAKALSSVAIGLLEGKKDEYRGHTDYYNALKILKIGWGNNE